MKKTLYKYRLILGFIFILTAFLTVTTSIQVGYTLTAPGYNDNLEDLIIIEDGIDEEGSFSTTSVIVLYKMPLLAKWFAENVDTVSVREIPISYTQTTVKDLNYRSLLMKDDSLAKSVIVAYLEAGIEIDYETKHLVSLVYDYLDEDTLELGDEIITINGQTLDNIPSYTCGDILTFEIIRDLETLFIDVTVKDVDGTCKAGIILGSLTTINDTSRDYTFVDNNTGGPSGGLMQSLYIFNELTETDYTYGLNIAGTGTINLDNTVGQIGGIDQKIITSALNGIDIFFCPEGNNCDDAEEIIKTLNTDMILVHVETLEDAINYLKEYGDNHE